jgi:hypothetical protein
LQSYEISFLFLPGKLHPEKSENPFSGKKEKEKKSNHLICYTTKGQTT